MTTPDPNAYLRTKVMTASPAELRLMLLDGAVKFARQGRDGLAAKDFEAAYNGITKCQDIIMELINSLRPEFDPTLCEKLSALYVFLYNRLIDASSHRDPTIIDEVVTLLEYERETWTLLMDQLQQHNQSSRAIADTAPTPGTVSLRG
ncbi:MAG: flagellar export chaperone FliS [Phycisphaerales bacterium]|nr:flagellar export chaperone FliS [Phycisphaerales bacterium]